VSTEDRVDAARERLARFMAEQGKKNTRQRGVIVEVFLGAGGHLTLQELQALVREQEGAVGYATVYRTMKMLEEAGVAVERNFGTGQARYELAEFGTHHDHLICVGCNRIIEFEDQLIEERQDQIAERHGFLVQRHRHEIYGLCADCQ
jgi:Fur family ferric uptake transcriptional regulator